MNKRDLDNKEEKIISNAPLSIEELIKLSEENNKLKLAKSLIEKDEKSNSENE